MSPFISFCCGCLQGNTIENTVKYKIWNGDEGKKDQRKKDRYGGKAKTDFVIPNGEKQNNVSGKTFVIHFLEIREFWVQISIHHI